MSKGGGLYQVFTKHVITRKPLSASDQKMFLPLSMLQQEITLVSPDQRVVLMKVYRYTCYNSKALCLTRSEGGLNESLPLST